MDNLYFGSGTSVPPLFRFDGTEVPFPKSLKNQLVSRFFVTFFALFIDFNFVV